MAQTSRAIGSSGILQDGLMFLVYPSKGVVNLWVLFTCGYCFGCSKVPGWIVFGVNGIHPWSTHMTAAGADLISLSVIEGNVFFTAVIEEILLLDCGIIEKMMLQHLICLRLQKN